MVAEKIRHSSTLYPCPVCRKHADYCDGHTALEYQVNDIQMENANDLKIAVAGALARSSANAILSIEHIESQDVYRAIHNVAREAVDQVLCAAAITGSGFAWNLSSDANEASNEAIDLILESVQNALERMRQV